MLMLTACRHYTDPNHTYCSRLLRWFVLASPLSILLSACADSTVQTQRQQLKMRWSSDGRRTENRIMKSSRRNTRYRDSETASIGIILIVSVIALDLCGCTPTQPSVQQRALLIENLEAAIKLDYQNLADGKDDRVQADDSIYQATKAQGVIEQLQQGVEVPQSEVNDALDVPPESLSEDARAEIIKELNTAEKCDELGEQTHDPGNDWLAWDSYREQRDRAAEISKAMSLDVDVPWSEIQEALRVPEFR